MPRPRDYQYDSYGGDEHACSEQRKHPPLPWRPFGNGARGALLEQFEGVAQVMNRCHYRCSLASAMSIRSCASARDAWVRTVPSLQPSVLAMSVSDQSR